MALTTAQIKHALPDKKNYKLTDSQGLFLLVTKTGSKYWRYKYRYFKKEKCLAIGVFPEVSLKEARITRDEARKLLHNNIDPSAEKKARKATKHVAVHNTLEAISREWYEIKSPGWAASHKNKVLSRLEHYIYPALGQRPISEVSSLELLNFLRGVEKQGKIETLIA